MVAHACNLAIQEVEIGKIKVEGQSGKKVQETLSQTIKAGYGSMHLSSQLGKK
jgi:hypothetical protein